MSARRESQPIPYDINRFMMDFSLVFGRGSGFAHPSGFAILSRGPSHR